MEDSPLKDIRLGKVTTEWAKSRGLPVFYKESVGSTNDWAKDESFKESSLAENVILYVTDHQSKGRGRNQNQWSTGAPGTSLLSSWSFYSDEIPLPVSSPRSGLALYKAAVATWPSLSWSLKAPNDLYLNDKKVAGLLLETLSQGDESRFIWGLGMNVTDAPNLETAISLLQGLGAQMPLLGEDWVSFLDRLFFELSLVIERFQEPLSESEAAALVHVLNLKPGKIEKYLSMDEDGTLTTTERTIPWSSI